MNLELPFFLAPSRQRGDITSPGRMDAVRSKELPTVRTTREIIQNALRAKKVIPSFNVAYLDMVPPMVDALRDTGSFGLIAVGIIVLAAYGLISVFSA